MHSLCGLDLLLRESVPTHGTKVAGYQETCEFRDPPQRLNRRPLTHSLKRCAMKFGRTVWPKRRQEKGIHNTKKSETARRRCAKKIIIAYSLIET